MKIKYNVLGYDDEYDDEYIDEYVEECDDDDAYAFSNIEIFLSSISEQEMDILKSCNIFIEKTTDDEYRLVTNDYVAYYVKTNTKDLGILLKKTENYYRYFAKNYYYKENDKNKNLVISKDGITVELIFVEGGVNFNFG